MRVLQLVIVSVGVAGCEPSSDATPRVVPASSALSGRAETLEYQSSGARREMFVELAKTSQREAGMPGPTLFPVLDKGEFRAAPGLSVADDLLSVADAGGTVDIKLSYLDPFGNDRREAFGGLSEREAAEAIARALLIRWHVDASRPVTLVRAPGAGYAAALVGDELRLNPAFVYMAAAPPK